MASSLEGWLYRGCDKERSDDGKEHRNCSKIILGEWKIKWKLLQYSRVCIGVSCDMESSVGHAASYCILQFDHLGDRARLIALFKP